MNCREGNQVLPCMGKAWVCFVLLQEEGTLHVPYAGIRLNRSLSFPLPLLNLPCDACCASPHAMYAVLSPSDLFKLEPIDFGRRVAVEKELLADPEAPFPNAVFDDSGNFLIYSTLLGIKVWHLVYVYGGGGWGYAFTCPPGELVFEPW
jgi:hypothetical protein